MRDTSLLVTLVHTGTCLVGLPRELADQVGDGTPVQLKWYDDRSGRMVTELAGFSGVHCPRGTIQVPAHLAHAWGLSPTGSSVQVSIHHVLPQALTVTIQPESYGDWEIFESQAGRIEEQLLSQIHFMRTGGTYPVFSGNTKSFFHVTSCQPTHEVQLAPGTEIHVAPVAKEEQSTQDDWQHVFQLATSTCPCTCGTNSSHQAFVNPQTWESLPQKQAFLSPAGTYLPLVASEKAAKQPSHVFVQLEKGDPSLDQSMIQPCAFVRRILPVLDVAKVCATRALPAISPMESLTLHPIQWLRNGQIVSNSSNVNLLELYQKQLADSTSRVVLYDGVIVDLKDADIHIMVRIPQAAAHTFFDFLPLQLIKLFETNMVAVDSNPINVYTEVPEMLESDIPEAFSPLYDSLHDRLNTFTKSQCHGCVLTGKTGTGKSFFLRRLQRRSQTGSLFGSPRFCRLLDCTSLVKHPHKTLVSMVQSLLLELYLNRPSMLILDGLDLLAPSEAFGSHEFTQASTAQGLVKAETLRALFVSFADLIVNGAPVIVMATSNSVDTLHPRLCDMGLFTHAFPMPNLTNDMRTSLLTDLLALHNLNASEFLPFLASHTEGCLVSDLSKLVQRLVHITESSLDGITQAHVDSALDGFEPQAMRAIHLHKSKTLWSSVGGMFEVRHTLKSSLELPLRYARLFSLCALRIQSGLLLYGPPGCGKTLIANAIANECAMNLISVKGPELLNKYIGASEKAVRDVFESAQTAKPCILFFDEFESIAPRRGHDNTGVTDRVVNQFLCLMDGVESLEGVFVIGATSRPDLIDPALLRPGRLDKFLYCAIPTSEEREDILNHLLSSISVSQVDTKALALQCDTFTGADLQAMVYTAQLNAVHEWLGTHTPENTVQDAPIPLTQIHLQQACLQTTPSLSDMERERLLGIYAAFSSHDHLIPNPSSRVTLA